MITRYFDSSIHILIDEMNMLLSKKSPDERIDYARYKFSEADFAIRLGAPFRHLARYPMQGKQGQDIIIDYKDFEVEVKYWRNWGVTPRKQVWAQSYLKAFNWLVEEIKGEKKNKSAIICGWFTFFEWSKLLQLGLHSGGATKHGNTPINEERLKILPFLKCDDGKLHSVQTNYEKSDGEIPIEGSDYVINWELHGKEYDMLNILMLH